MDRDSSTGLRQRVSVSSIFAQFGGLLGTGNGGDQEMDIILLDHCYSKPWSSHPDVSNARPVQMLFMSKQKQPTDTEMERLADPPIDVIGVPPSGTVAFDLSKARNLMSECERHAAYARADAQEDWEEKIQSLKCGWSIQQTRVFTKVIKALQADRLARLAMDSAENEPIARRLLIDKTVKRIRQALACVGWDSQVVQWLHQIILDHVSIHLLVCYLDALQTLRSKVPGLVDKMLSGVPPKHPSLSQEALALLLKRPWDPLASTVAQHKPKRLPNCPLLVLAPSGPLPGGSGSGHAKRLKLWQSQLNGLGKVVSTHMSGGSGISIALCMEQMIGALRTKVLELKSHNPDKPVILIGWDIGAVVSCHVSLVENVSAVVCLGFPSTGIHGARGDCEDPLLNGSTPTLYVIGQNATKCSLRRVEELREHMRVETGLVVVGGADDQLRISLGHKKKEGITQAVADLFIINEIGQFLGSTLAKKSGVSEHPAADLTPADLRKKRKRKLYQDQLATRPAGQIHAAKSASLDSVNALAALGDTAGSPVVKQGSKAARHSLASAFPFASDGDVGEVGRKRLSRGSSSSGLGSVARKRLALGRDGTKGRAARHLQPPAPQLSLSGVSNAPELYGLLQGIQLARSSGDSPVMMAGGRAFMATSLARPKLLKFNTSKLRDDAGGSSAGSAATTVFPMTIKSGEGGDPDKSAQQQQILVRTSGSVPICMSSPLVHITGVTSSSQIHQLLTASLSHGVAASASAAGASPQPTLLVNSTASVAGTRSPSLTVNAKGELTLTEKKGSGSVGSPQLAAEQSAGYTTAGSAPAREEDPIPPSTLRASQYHDFPLTTASTLDPKSVLSSAVAKPFSAVLETASVGSSFHGSVSSAISKAIVTHASSISQALNTAAVTSVLGSGAATISFSRAIVTQASTSLQAANTAALTSVLGSGLTATSKAIVTLASISSKGIVTSASTSSKPIVTLVSTKPIVTLVSTNSKPIVTLASTTSKAHVTQASSNSPAINSAAITALRGAGSATIHFTKANAAQASLIQRAISATALTSLRESGTINFSKAIITQASMIPQAVSTAGVTSLDGSGTSMISKAIVTQPTSTTGVPNFDGSGTSIISKAIVTQASLTSLATSTAASYNVEGSGTSIVSKTSVPQASLIPHTISTAAVTNLDSSGTSIMSKAIVSQASLTLLATSTAAVNNLNSSGSRIISKPSVPQASLIPQTISTSTNLAGPGTISKSIVPQTSSTSLATSAAAITAESPGTVQVAASGTTTTAAPVPSSADQLSVNTFSSASFSSSLSTTPSLASQSSCPSSVGLTSTTQVISAEQSVSASPEVKGKAVASAVDPSAPFVTAPSSPLPLNAASISVCKSASLPVPPTTAVCSPGVSNSASLPVPPTTAVCSPGVVSKSASLLVPPTTAVCSPGVSNSASLPVPPTTAVCSPGVSKSASLSVPPTTAVCSPGVVSKSASLPVLSMPSLLSPSSRAGDKAASGSGSLHASSPRVGQRASRSASAVSYQSSTKPVLPSVASTRTRRIKTPRHYDL